jgi:Galactose oxidase, central domain
VGNRLGGGRDFRKQTKKQPMKAIKPLRILGVAILPTLFALAGVNHCLGDDASTSLTWSALNPANGLPARTFFASAYDPVSRRIVVFGGADNTGQLDETWTYDGTTWTQVETPVSPGPRAAAAMAYDRSTKKLVLFGGFVGFTILHDTWLWDGATLTWTEALPRAIPTGATNPMLFTDPANGRVDMFGGYQGQFYSRSMWQWTGTNWKLLNPTTTPYPRSGAITVLDPVRRNVVLFGGISDNWIVQNTWTWDGRDWTLRTPATTPPPLYFTTGGFDPVLGEVIAFGGGSQGVDQKTTWAWDGSNWTKLAPAANPPAREGFGTAWFPPAHQFLIFDGSLFPSGRTIDDMWELSGP